MGNITFSDIRRTFLSVFLLVLISSFSTIKSYGGDLSSVSKRNALFIDTDGDGVPNGTDIDDDNDGIIDTVEGEQTDTDGDGIPNSLDIDSDDDGILDNVEAQTTAGYIAPCGIDTDGNGLDDHYEETPGSCGGLTPVDTDSDGIPDYLDIDSDNDGILDNVEAQTSAGFVPVCTNDSDGNGLDDHYESHPGAGEGITPVDTDGDGKPDFRDIDSDDDGIPDNVEAQTTAGYVPPTGVDTDNDGLDNAYEGSGDDGLTPVNTDGTDEPDFRDTDTDNDLVPDNNEGNDFNFDGIPDQTYKGIDSDGDGLDDGYEGSDLHDGFDVNDEIDDPANDLPDTDGTEDVNYRDLDDDGDGIDTPDEDANNNGDPTDDDTDNDGTPDYLDPDTNTNPDTDGDGVKDKDEEEDETDPKDPCSFLLESQTVTPTSEWDNLDCDGDGVTNSDEVTDGTDPLDPCSFNPDSVTLDTSGDYLVADCDGDGVTNGDEATDGTDPTDPCSFLLASQTVTTSSEWDNLDCDGDGVTNSDEVTDGTDPLDPCSFNPDSITVAQSGDYLVADCDGDGVTNGDEATDGTDPQDPCSFLLASQTVTTSSDWDNLDCDGDGVTNSDEVTDGTDPLDPCSLILESQTVPPSDAWALLDCDGDGNPNGGDPNPLLATAADDEGSTPALTEVVINILANDDYLPNNDPANVGTTSITRIGGDATGEVSFDPNTGELTYIPAASESNTSVTIVYQVCNVAPDPDVCASATVTISVGNDVLDAVDDDYTGTPFYGVTGGVLTGLNVLDNDTFNGEPVVPAAVTITSTPTGPLTINENGTITLAPGTDPGTYTIEYTICEVANPSNCDSATVTVQVTSEPPAIDAVDDVATTTASGGVVTDLNVLDNDILNGNPVNLADVVLTSTPTGPLTINSDGTVTVAPDTDPGTYTIIYTICEVADPTNCDSATVTIEVTSVPPVIDAVDDEAEVTPAEGLSGGIISNFNVLDNDTLDGVPVDPADVVISSTPTGTLTINSDGTVSVNAETEAGTFTIEYTICEITNPSNCDTATVTIVVASPPLVDAVDDAASVSDAEGIAGGSISGLNIFDNDTLDGDPLNPSEVTLTSTPTGPLTINSDGSVSLAPDTTEGTYTIQYTICEIANPDNCDTATVTVIVRSPANIIVLKVDTFNDENGDGYAQVGETISYAFTVINTGSVPLGNITVTDPLVTVNGGPLQILEPGESDNTTFTATYTITQEDLENGFFANSAFVNAFVPDNGPVGSLSDDPDDPTDVDTDGDGNPDDLTVTDLIESPLQEIDAVDDDYTTIAVDGATGGLVPDSNVLDNDTLNGEAVDPADVLITSTPTGPLTVNSDGTVSVAPGTPNGLYVIDYTICEIANSSNCDTATVTVLVSTVIVDFKIEVNQMVTPNNDGRNDFLFIKDVAFARNNTLRIYNRWGIAVYEGTNYNNQNNVFDGRSRGRSTLSVQDYLPAGVYFYIFEYDLNEERITDSGYLYLSK